MNVFIRIDFAKTIDNRLKAHENQSYLAPSSFTLLLCYSLASLDLRDSGIMVCTQHFRQHPFANSRLRLATLILTLLAGALNSAWANSAAAVDRHQHTVIDRWPSTNGLGKKRQRRQPRLSCCYNGRTWSSVPDFDLQVPGESLSFMDGLNALGYAVYALDARGYGRDPHATQAVG